MKSALNQQTALAAVQAFLRLSLYVKTFKLLKLKLTRKSYKKYAPPMGSTIELPMPETNFKLVFFKQILILSTTFRAYTNIL